MPYSRKRCRRCGHEPGAGETISARGLCRPCGLSAMVQEQLDLERRRGRHYDHWVQRQIEAAERLAAEQAARLRTPV